jgi:undecaprenyl-diphosphatase
MWWYQADLWLFRLINQQLACPALDFLMRWITWLGRGELEVPLILAYWIWRRREQAARRLAILCLAAWATSGIISTGAKQLVNRERPTRVAAAEARTPGEHLRSKKSFPSGHTVSAFALAFVIAPRVRRRWRAVPWLLAAAVGFSRIYLGVHWPLDVVGGAAIGVASAALVVAGANWLARGPRAPRAVDRNRQNAEDTTQGVNG